LACSLTLAMQGKERDVAAARYGNRTIELAGPKGAPNLMKLHAAYVSVADFDDLYFRYLPVCTGTGSIHHTDDGFPLPNTRATTFVIGKLYVHVLSTSVRSGISRQRIKVPSVAQLWPHKASPIAWPRNYVSPLRWKLCAGSARGQGWPTWPACPAPTSAKSLQK